MVRVFLRGTVVVGEGCLRPNSILLFEKEIMGQQGKGSEGVCCFLLLLTLHPYRIEEGDILHQGLEIQTYLLAQVLQDHLGCVIIWIEKVVLSVLFFQKALWRLYLIARVGRCKGKRRLFLLGCDLIA